MTDALCVLGVDPGVSGATAFFFPSAPDRVAAEDMPVAGNDIDCATLAKRVTQIAPSCAVIERVNARPGQGVCSVFKFGRAYGSILGALSALEIAVHLVTPSVWKKHFRLDADKEAARALALRLFPATSAHFTSKRDHHRSEAALIALYGAQRLFEGRNP